MENTPYISVIIPVYNVENYIEECMDSVSGQTLENIEIICINDKSFDNSLNILQRYHERDNRVVIINNDTHKGVSYSRNIGLERAVGKYIYFVDADDLLKEDALLELYEVAEDSRLDGVFFDADIIFETEELKDHTKYNNKRRFQYQGVYAGKRLFAEHVQYNELDPCVWKQFWNRAYLDKNKLQFYNNIIHEDRLFTFQAMLTAGRTKCISKSYYVYRKRAASVTTSEVTLINIEGVFEGLYEMLEFWKANSYEQEVDRAIHKYIVSSFSYIKELIKRIDNESGSNKLSFQNNISECLYEILSLHEYMQSISGIQEKLNTIKQAENVIIYGAGFIARKVLMEFDNMDIPITGIAVTNKELNPKSILGNRVYGINELLEYKIKSVVVIAVSSAYQNEIEDLLLYYGFNNYIKV